MNVTGDAGLLQLACMVLLVGVLPGCGGNSSEPDMSLPVMPEVFDTVQAVYTSTPLGTPVPVDISSIVDDDRPGMWVTGVASRNGTDIVGIARRIRTSTPGVEFDEYLIYDTQQVSFSSVLQRDPLHSTTLSADLSTAAWIEQCLGFVQPLGVDENSVLINPFAQSGSCLRPAQLSADGNVALFSNARGVFDEAGELQFDGFESERFGPVAYTLSRGNAVNLGGQDLQQQGIDLGENIPVYLRSSLSDDGRIIAFRLAIVPDNYSSLGEIEFRAGLLIVDTDSGSFSLRDSHQERRSFCPRCYFNPATDTLVSGDGRFMYFLRPDDAELLDPSSDSALYRHDISRNETHRLPVEDRIEENTLTVDRSGNHIAYMAEDTLLVLALDTGERIELNSALRGCVVAECEFENFRIVQSNPFIFSGDGSALLIQIVPEYAGIDEPQNSEEVMLLDLPTQTVARVAPDVSIDRIAIGDSGEFIAFQSVSSGLIPDDDDFDTDFFLLRR